MKLKKMIDRFRDIFSESIPILNEDTETPISRKQIVLLKAQYLSRELVCLENRQSLNSTELSEFREEEKLLLKANESNINKDEIIARLNKARLDLKNEAYDIATSIKKAEETISEIASDLVTSGLEYTSYLKHSLGRSRESMPQISTEALDKYAKHFQNSTGIILTSKKPTELKPTQIEFDDSKIINILEAYLKGEYDNSRTFVISKDNYLVDGHHNWASLLEINPNIPINCYMINLPIKELLRRSNLMKLTKNVDISDKEISKAISDYQIGIFQEIDNGT